MNRIVLISSIFLVFCLISKGESKLINLNQTKSFSSLMIPADTDISVQEYSMVNNTCTGVKNDVQVTLKNNGSAAVSGVALTIGCQINKQTPVEEYFEQLIFLTGETKTFTLSNPINLDIVGNDTITFYIRQAFQDSNPENDTLVSVVTVKESPVDDWESDTIIENATSFVLDAGEGMLSYQWQDNSTNRFYDCTFTGLYSVTVASSNNCFTTKSKFVIFSFTDIAVRESHVPNYFCSGLKNISVDLLNLGKDLDSISLTIGVQVNNQTPIEEEFNLPETYWKLDSLCTFTFTNPININFIGDNTLTFYVRQNQDTNPQNDSLVKAFTVMEAPTDDWNFDTLFVNLPYELDGGVDMISYQWEDASNSRYYTCNFEGFYSVTVMSATSKCSTTKSMYLAECNCLDKINEITAKNLQVELYPNLTDEFLKINASLLTGEEFTIELIDGSNHIVWSDKHKGLEAYSNTLDVKGFASGIYYVRFSNTKVNEVQKIIVY